MMAVPPHAAGLEATPRGGGTQGAWSLESHRSCLHVSHDTFDCVSYATVLIHVQFHDTVLLSWLP